MVTIERYLDCGTCGAAAGRPCNDMRWYWKYGGMYRYTRRPHPGRRHT